LVLDEYFDVNGQSVCASCRDTIAQHGQPSRGSGPFVRACLFGVGAAIAGAILYYAVIAITNFEIGIVAIAIGYMVGYAIRKGAGGRGGRRFQVVAVVLTYWSVGLAYVPLAMKDAAEQSTQETQVQAGAPATPVQSGPETRDVSLTRALMLLFGFSFALPVLVAVGSLPGGLISAAIIAFGMQQAWRMTGVLQLTITGPYQIGRSDPATT
jgi:hypothetical protein